MSELRSFAYAPADATASGERDWQASATRIRIAQAEDGKFQCGIVGPSPFKSAHWNEGILQSSLWPELCCALTMPWWMAGRVWQKLGHSGRDAFFVAAGLLILATPGYAYSLIGDAEESASAPPKWLTALGMLGWLGQCAGIAYLRGEVRKQAGIPGGRLEDFTATCPLLCCATCVHGWPRELAVMDRELSPAPLGTFTPGQEGGAGAPHLDDAANGIKRKWSSELFGCNPRLDGDCPQFQCAIACPAFILTRVLLRLGQPSGLAAAALVVLQLLPWLLVLIMDAVKASTGWWIFAHVMLITNLLGVGATVWLRGKLRAAYGIEGTMTDDVTVSALCSACAISQMERESAKVQGIRNNAPLAPPTAGDATSLLSADNNVPLPPVGAAGPISSGSSGYGSSSASAADGSASTLTVAEAEASATSGAAKQEPAYI